MPNATAPDRRESDRREAARPRADFKVFAQFDAAYEKDGRPYLRGIGSSTIVDLGGDRMEESALKDMQAGIIGRTIFADHRYDVMGFDGGEGAVFGKCTKAEIVYRDGYADLELEIAVATTSKAAMNTYRLVSVDGIQLGISVGCFIDEWEYVKANKDTGTEGYFSIMRVTVLEFSIVGIPANPRSWVELAAKGLTERPDWVGQAKPAERRTARPGGASALRGAEVTEHADGSITLRATDGKELRVGATSDAGEVASRATLSTRDLSTLYGDGPVTMTRAQLAAKGVTVKDDDGDDDADADKKAQEARSAQYHIGIKDGGNVTKPGEYANVPDEEWGDPVNYRYPMPDKEHADNAASRWGDAGNRSQYTEDEQRIIGDRIAARQRHFGEDDSDKDKDKTVSEPLTRRMVRRSLQDRLEQAHDYLALMIGHRCMDEGAQKALGAELSVSDELREAMQKALTGDGRERVAKAHDHLARYLGMDCGDAAASDVDGKGDGPMPAAGAGSDNDGDGAYAAPEPAHKALADTLDASAAAFKATGDEVIAAAKALEAKLADHAEKLAAAEAATKDAREALAGIDAKAEATKAELDETARKVKELGETSTGRPTLRVYRRPNGTLDYPADWNELPTAELSKRLESAEEVAVTADFEVPTAAE